MFEQLVNNPFLYSLSLTLVHFLWQGLLVGLMLKSTLLIIDKNKAKLRYGLASFSMLANLIIVIFTFVMVYPDSGTSNNLSPIPLNNLVAELTQQWTMLTYQELIPSILAYVLPYLAIFWLATIVMLAGKLLIEVRNVNHLPWHASVSPTATLLARFDELAKQLELPKTPKLVISLKAKVPMAIGWLKPVVLLPASMVTGLGPSQLEMLILHELAHIRRHDYLVNFLQTLIELLLFFHPSVHWIGKQMRNEREYCSDDLAVQHCGDAIAYAHTLTDTASLCAKKHNHTIPVMAMAASGGDLKARVIRLVDHHCAPSNGTGKWLAAFSLLLALSLLSINQLLTISFSSHLHNQFPWSANDTGSNTQGNKITKTSPLPDNRSRKVSVVNNLITLPLLSHKETLTNNSLIDNIRSRSDTAVEAKTTIVLKPAMIKADAMESNPNLIEVAVQSEPSHIIPHDQLPTDELATSKASQLVNLRIQQTPITLKPTKLSQAVEIASLLRRATPSHEEHNIKPTDKLSSVAVQRVQSADINAQQAVILTNESQNKKIPASKLSYSQEIDEFVLQNERYKASQRLNSTPKERVETVTSYAARLLSSANPVYPYLAQRRHIEMEVKVNFTIGLNGKVKNIEFGPQDKTSYFKSAIRSAIRKWRFSPAVKNNDIIESRMSKIFSFSLQS
ncbi:MAG: TonB family protein [Colwellia sp.]